MTHNLRNTKVLLTPPTGQMALFGQIMEMSFLKYNAP